MSAFRRGLLFAALLTLAWLVVSAFPTPLQAAPTTVLSSGAGFTLRGDPKTALTAGWTQVVQGGFTDPNNSYAPAWIEFNDYLYVSTAANPGGSIFSGSDKAGGDIWRTSDGVTWEQVGTPGLGNPHNSSFNFVVFKDKLYALANNLNDHGLEIWASSDGTNFRQLEGGGFGDKNNDWGVGFVFRDRLIVCVANAKSGAGIWASDDGESFRPVVSAGMGHAGVTGFAAPPDPQDPAPLLDGDLYLGVSNPRDGGEIWRTPDGVAWERVAEKGLGRPESILLSPSLVFKGNIYAFGTAGGTLDNLLSLDLFRSSDGATWEQIVEDGFGTGKERNVQGVLTEFRGRLYLTSNTADPRVLVPGAPQERVPLKGFQLRVSDDGETWTKLGEDGFGLSTSFTAGLAVFGDEAFLTVFDYHQGAQLWRSAEGKTWQLLLREPEPNFFQEGGGPLDLKGRLIWISNDLKNGVEIWTSDAVLVAEAPVTTTPSTEEAAPTVTTSAPATTNPPSGGAGRANGGGAGDANAAGEGGSAGALSSAWLALIIALAAIAVAAVVALAFSLGRLRGKERRHPAAGPGPASHPGPYCSSCGEPLPTGAGFCAHCGSRVTRF